MNGGEPPHRALSPVIDSVLLVTVTVEAFEGEIEAGEHPGA